MSRALPKHLGATLSPAAAREHLQGRLEAELYHSFYARGAPIPYRPVDVAPAWSDPGFVEQLSAANVGGGAWEAGWSLQAADDGLIGVARDGLRVRVPPSECRPPRAAPDTSVRVRRLKEHRSALPGFYVALGDADDTDAGETVETRVYLHVTAAGAAPLIAIATRSLNEAALPFSLKVVNHPAGFTRCDAAVLYLRHGDFSRARTALRQIAAACAPHLRPEPPALTRPLCHGMAVAEHLPSHGASFGSSRCRMIAEGVIAAHERRVTGLAARLDAVERSFAKRGLDLDVPYLAPGSSDDYVL